MIPNVEDRIEKTTKVEKKTLDIEEKGVKLRLSIVDTPGFGDAINCEDSWKVCTAYIEEQVKFKLILLIILSIFLLYDL